MEEREEKTEVKEGPERRVSIANGGPAHVHAVGRRGSRARGSIAKPSGSEMTFSDVCVDAGGKRILWSVSGKAVPGQMLAIMGPSGAGKTTLLNALAGQTPISSGQILVDSRRISKKMKRQVSYVQQADIFFPNLTLRETLRYSALIRLPSELSIRQKLNKVEEIIATLRLQDCATTRMGDAAVRGLSGGEKKRANIGCELLTSPSLILLDEPTSGLDSTSALSLLELLRSQLACQQNKTIVMSIHQPSSQMYYKFDNLLLLAKGKTAYFGPVRNAMSFFSSVGLHCDLQYNPADYMMDLVTNDDSRKILIGEDPKQETRPKKLSAWQRALQWVRLSRGEREGNGEEGEVGKGNIEILEYKNSPKLTPFRAVSAVNPIATIEEFSPDDITEEAGPVTIDDDGSETSEEDSLVRERKWPTSWWWQVCVLTVRTFRQSRFAILSPSNIFLAVALSVVTSLCWFQLPETEKGLTERFGILFFTIIFWSFNPLFIALTTFPSERVVVNKERSSGSYHLSAYYLAKTISELPLILLLPSIYMVIVYWAAGLNGWSSFFGSWFFILCSGFMAQSLGLFISATVTNRSTAITMAALAVLTSMLLGGFYVRVLPFWLDWAKNLSFVTYGYDALLQLEFTDNRRFTCNEVASSYLSCNATTVLAGYHGSGSGGSPGNGGVITGADVIREYGGVYPLYVCFLAMLGFSTLYRLLAYLSLRYLHRHSH